MENEQLFEPANRNAAYFTHAYAVDGFDIAIRPVVGGDDLSKGEHAKVELVFLQNKGNGNTEVVAAIRMQVLELERLVDLANHRIEAFRGKREKRS